MVWEDDAAWRFGFVSHWLLVRHRYARPEVQVWSKWDGPEDYAALRPPYNVSLDQQQEIKINIKIKIKMINTNDKYKLRDKDKGCRRRRAGIRWRPVLADFL